ncbi:hypothetical protein ACIBCD_39255 [Nocardia brasiliensis]|uniref:effector-associated constant component EACC1 n=1 Tax=Nocardia brasiliensis TaxID=37326 RepID=UPI00245394A8|nr:hypothetical protein [Nocardia brasiliensis]
MSNHYQRLLITSDGEPDDLLQLLDWFRNDDALRGRVQPESPEFRDNQMGGLYDVLAVAVGVGGVAPALASSLSTWLTHRRSDITLKLTRADGTEIELDARRVSSSDAVEELRKLLDTPDDPL